MCSVVLLCDPLIELVGDSLSVFRRLSVGLGGPLGGSLLMFFSQVYQNLTRSRLFSTTHSHLACSADTAVPSYNQLVGSVWSIACLASVSAFVSSVFSFVYGARGRKGAFAPPMFWRVLVKLWGVAGPCLTLSVRAIIA